MRGERAESSRRRVGGGFGRFGGGSGRHARGVADVRAYRYTRVNPDASDFAGTHAFRCRQAFRHRHGFRAPDDFPARDEFPDEREFRDG